MVKGSRLPEVPRPAAHHWMIVCRDRGRTVDEQAEQVLSRLRPFEAELSALGARLDGDTAAVHLVLRAVRFFGGTTGEDEQIVALPDGSEKLSGQHQLLGWSLSNEDLRFLVTIGASLDVDEYG